MVSLPNLGTRQRTSAIPGSESLDHSNLGHIKLRYMKDTPRCQAQQDSCRMTQSHWSLLQGAEKIDIIMKLC